MNEPLKLMIGVPAYRGQVHYGHIMQMMSMCSVTFAARGLLSLRGITCPESCSIDWSRNQILHYALKDGSDWVLMCDADTYHTNAADLVRMIEEARIKGAAVVASPVKMRGRAGYNVFTAGDASEKRIVPSDEFAGKVLEVDRIGTACMAVNCGWIRDRWADQPWFVTQHLPGVAPSKVGEDVAFCDGVRSRGGVILADGRFEPRHIGAE